MATPGDATSTTPENRAELIVRTLLAVKPGEQVALVTDPSSEPLMVAALREQIQTVGAEFTVLMQPDRATGNKNELTPVVQAALEAADCLIGLTRSGGAPTYHRAVKKLYREKRLRGLSMVMRTLENFTSGGALADYGALRREGARLAQLWRQGREIHLTTPSGTDIWATIADEEVFVECGFATEPGQEAAFSDGEVSQMPNVGSARGRLVVDGPIAHLGTGESVELQVQSGRVVRVESEGSRSERLREITRDIPDADNIAEIGIGLNDCCRRNGDFEEEKKARGLVHVAIGDNVFYGGDVACAVHMDMVLYSPTVRIDNRLVVEAGEIVFDAS